VANEAWLRDLPGHAQHRLAKAVGRPPLEGVRATFRGDVEARLRSDPLARAVLWTLAGLALVGFGLALAGLAVALGADLRDERGELFDLEAQGARPSALRRHVRLRSSGVLALGVLGGAALAAVLSVLVVDVVLVTANGRLPEPPLLLDVNWPLVLAALLAYLVCATGLVSLATRRALR
jgi:ABC-type antimicrobial peptide transport system permease subunit